jgi:FkbM family methyltransferase
VRLKSLAVVALLAAGALAWAASGAGSWLRLEHRLKLAAKRWSKTVTRVEVPGAEPFAMFLNPDDRTVSPALWTWGLWEPNETRWFVRSLRPGDVVVDVGANIGYYTLLGARLVGESGRVYAFEPDPASFEILARNVRLNGLDNVVLEQKAVSKEAGTLELFLAEHNKGDHRIYAVEGEDRPAIAVEAVALDDYFADRPDGVDFVKVDAQGAEGVILDGMRGLIERSDELVMAFEYSPRALAGMRYHAPHLLRVFRKSGFTLFDLGSGGEAPRQSMAPVAAAQLNQRYPLTGDFFTNLLLVKGRPELVEAIRGGAAEGASP